VEWRNPIIFYTKEAGRSPSDPLAHNNLGLACAREARTCASLAEAAAYRALAEREYKTAITLDAGYVAARKNLANIYMEAGRYGPAAENFRKTVAKDPDPVSYNNMAVCLYRLGDLDGTIAACKEALLLDPGYSDAYVNLGNAFYMKGMFRPARMSWSRAARLGADAPEMLAGIEDLKKKGY
jgi:tetratricopeptide (TPR) repeat protein